MAATNTDSKQEDDLNWYLDVHQVYPEWIYVGRTKLEVIIYFHAETVGYHYLIQSPIDGFEAHGIEETFAKCRNAALREVARIHAMQQRGEG